MRVTHRFVHADGLRLHLLDHGGSGTPIVLQHGVTGHAFVWSGVADRLTSVGLVLAMDYRGFGDSQWSPDGVYTTDRHVADLEAVVAFLDAPRVDLVGSSWGGLVSIAFASRHRDLVRRMALVDVAPSSTQAEDDVPPMAYDFADHAEVVAAERASNPNAPQEMIEILAAHGTRPGEDGRLYRKRDPVLMTRWPFRADDRWEELTALDLPVLVVHAAESFIPFEVAERVASETGAGSVVEIERSGHVVPVENPGALADALERFFSERR